VTGDVGRFVARLRGNPLPKPGSGLYTYRFHPPGGSIRIHLRVESDGAGVLFVDVTDVLHLNATAATLAYLALEGVPLQQALDALTRTLGGRQKAALARQATDLYELIERLRDPGRGCPTCSVPWLERSALFGTRARAPYKVDLALTYACNNDCPHCYNEPERFALESLPLEDWKRVVDQLCRVGVPHLILTGGEATLHPDVAEIIAYADSQGPVVGLNTNGRRLAFRSFAEQLVAAGLNHVQVTLGSNRPEVHDRMMASRSFHQTLRGIENALGCGLHTITNTTLMRQNADHVEEIITFLHSRGIRTFAMNAMIYSGGGFATPEAIPEPRLAPLLVRIRDLSQELGMRFLWYTPTEYCRMSPVELEIGAKRCNAGEYSLCIEPNGDVLPCQSYYVAAGNVLRDPWEKIWDASLLRSFRDREDDPRRHGLPEKCWECPDLPLCGGGCRIEREARDGHRISTQGGCGGCSGCGTDHKTADRGSKVETVPSAQRVAGFVSLESLTRNLRRRASGEFQ
jgi:radical SAM protein with 4Fe4S-binding SPASM domain